MIQPKTHNGESQRKSILIVDDERPIVEVISEAAEWVGYNTIPALSGEEALELFRKNKPDLITVDIGMPEMDGFELVTHIRKLDALVPIIIISGWDTSEARDRALTLGANAFIGKPFDLTELFEELGTLLNKTPIERENDRLTFSNSLLSGENAWLKKQIEELQRIKTTETTDVSAEKDQAFYATIAHDLTNELSQIGAALREIRRLAADSDEIKEVCDVVERSLHYSGQILRRLKNYTEIVKPHLESIDIYELLKKAESLIRPRIPSNIVFEVNINSSELDGKVLVDVEHVTGVLIEITNNAVHALRNSEGVIKLTANVQDGMLGIAISNNGPPIPNNIRERLFKQRVQSSKKKGTGMGLFLANQVLSTFGGTISSTEPMTDWITFEIRLPLYAQ